MPPEPRVQLRPADALIIVPPFAGLDRPSLGAHVLQACAKARGVTVSVLYANLLLGGEVGEPTYQAVCYGPSGALLGERFFAAAAFGTPPFGYDDAYVSYFSDRSAPRRRSRDRPHRADAASASPRRVARRRGRAGGRAEVSGRGLHDDVRTDIGEHRSAQPDQAPSTRDDHDPGRRQLRWPYGRGHLRPQRCGRLRVRWRVRERLPHVHGATCWPVAGPANA